MAAGKASDAEITRLTEALADATGERDTALSDLQAAEATIIALEATIASLTLEETQLAQAEEARDLALAQLETALAEVSTLQKALEAAGDTSDAEITRLTEALADATGERDTALSDLQAAEADIAALNEALEAVPAAPVPLAEALELLRAGAHGAVIEAATTLPGFDAITQSSRKGGDGVSADTLFAGSDHYASELSVYHHDDGSETRLTGRDHVATDPMPATTSFLHRRADTLIGYSDDTLAMSRVIIDWDDSDYAQYLASGYWMRADGISGEGPAIVTTGVFVDGPELANTAPVPVAGMASYRGPATALFVYSYGVDKFNRPAGSRDVGEVTGTATLTADFAAASIEGCIGCDGGLDFSGHITEPDGPVGRYHPANYPVQILLGAASFDHHGSFTSDETSVSAPATAIASQIGAWGGRFSSTHEDGVPRLAAGTFGVEWTEEDGTTGAYLGSFVAATE